MTEEPIGGRLSTKRQKSAGFIFIVQDKNGRRCALGPGPDLATLLKQAQKSRLADKGEGQRLARVLANLFDQLLWDRHGDWRAIMAGDAEATPGGYLIARRLNKSAVAAGIEGQLPAGIEEKDTAATIKKHAAKAVDLLLSTGGHGFAYTPRQLRMAYRTLFGLAWLVWRKKTGSPNPDRSAIEYPEDIEVALMDQAPSRAPISEEELRGCLDQALCVVKSLCTEK